MKYYSLIYSTNHSEIGPDFPQAGPAKEYDERLKEKLAKKNYWRGNQGVKNIVVH